MGKGRRGMGDRRREEARERAGRWRKEIWKERREMGEGGAIVSVT
jgi:hypothetical protein